ncbi:xaa-Pro aminopeptidase 2-like protein [Labeo rohita]|uniref:Xaa-Pro aminopeptidase 2-like protein n=1 Tax=Labeo rohita TaxID=84645 RepID=A0A498LGD8_LABRO|nr:xaa-Pro aminopeptidase 2-like protein [Labeo rohita]
MADITEETDVMAVLEDQESEKPKTLLRKLQSSTGSSSYVYMKNQAAARWHPKATAQDGSNPWKRIHGIVMGLRIPWGQRFDQEERKK